MGCAAPRMGNTMTATESCPADFAGFFTELWGKRPFSWQNKLAERVLEHAKNSNANPSVHDVHGDEGGTKSPWPEAIVLPTASGKTACLDVAVFALAVQASWLASGKAMTVPRRFFFVVDRRVIVDEAYERARCMANKLTHAKSGILKTVADNRSR